MEKATEVLIEILQLIPANAQNYDRRKHILMSRDKQEIQTSIRLTKQEIEATAIRNDLEKELTYLNEALRILQIEVAKEGCRQTM